MSKKICIVAGARPNFIKVAPVMRAIENARNAGGEMECKLVYTGREDDERPLKILFSLTWVSASRMFIWAWNVRI